MDIDNLVDALKATILADGSVLRDMADADRELLLQQFTWGAVADRLCWAVKTLRGYTDIAQHRARIGWLTTWGTRCEIATRSQYLVENAPHGTDVALAPQVSAGDLVCADEEFVLRNQIVGRESNYLKNLQPHINVLKLGVIVIQFNYGSFNHRKLSAFIRR